VQSPVVKTLKLTPGKTFLETMDVTFLGSPVNLTDYTLCFLLEVSELLQSLILMVYLALLIWNIVIMGHILRHAMETTLGVGIVFAMIYLVITSTLISVALPQLEPV